MGSCTLIKPTGIRCGSTYQLNPIYLRDGIGLIKKELMICQTDKQIVFGEYKIKDNSALNQIRKLESKQNILEAYFIHKDDPETYEKIIRLGIRNRTRINLEHELAETKKLMRSWKEIRYGFRDKYCRICWHPLICRCEQCKTRQHGDQYSSAMTYGYSGSRGEFYPLHIICGRILFQRFGIMLLETKSPQQTL